MIDWEIKNNIKWDIFKISIENISQTFKIQIEKENTYFGYIFDYSRIKDEDYSSMLDDCKKIIINFAFLKLKMKFFAIKTEGL